MTREQSISKPLDDIENEFERAIFLSNYNSRKQQRRRVYASIILGLKHGLRGILFSWPLYLLPFATLALPGQYKLLFILFLLPGLLVSGWILSKGVQEDYLEYVQLHRSEKSHEHQAVFPCSTLARAQDGKKQSVIHQIQ